MSSSNDENPTTSYEQYNTQQNYNIQAGHGGDNGVTFGLNSPMAFSPNNTFSPTNNSNNFGLDPNQATVSNNEWDASAESLARQQIMAEINETKFLMKGSVTPDAISFWKKHLEELSQRLVKLSLEEQLQAAGSAGGGTDLNDTSYDNNATMYSKANAQYQAPHIQSHEEYLENNRRMREQMGLGAVVAQPTPATMADGTYPHGDENLIEARVESVTSMPKKHLDELPVCDVVAPSDLPGGYMFEAQLGSKKFLATVPPGGVTKGQRFASTMQELETIEIPVPLGGWRDGLMDCFSHGLCHPLFLNTLIFPCSEYQYSVLHTTFRFPVTLVKLTVDDASLLLSLQLH